MVESRAARPLPTSGLWLALALAGGALVVLLTLPGAEAQMPPAAPPAPAASNCNYVIDNNIPFSWDEISTNGTGLGSFNDYSRTWVTPVPPMPFYFCSFHTYDYHLVSKGHVCLGPNTGGLPSSPPPPGCSPCCPYWPSSGVPSTSVNRPAIFGYYSDIFPGGCTPSFNGASCVYWKVLGTSPNRRLVYEFKQVPYYSNTGPGPLTFEIKLFETTGCMEVHYQSVTAQNNYDTVAGFQTGAGTVGWQYEFNANGFTAANTAWRACPQALPPTAPLKCLPALAKPDPGPVTIYGAGGSGTYTWSVAPSTGVTPPSGSGPTWTPNFKKGGTYTVTLTDSLGATTTCSLTVLVKQCGYKVNLVEPVWDEIEATGTKMAWTWDTSSSTITPGNGFSFTLCGTEATSFRLSSKGHICLQPSVNCGSCCGIPSQIPGTGLARAAVMGYYADLHPGKCGVGGTVVPSWQGNGQNCIYWQVIGTGIERRLVYEFKAVPYWCCGTNSGTNTFQIKLYDETDCVEVVYLSTAPNSGGYASGAGFQDATGTSGYQFLYSSNSGVAITSPTAWRACPWGADEDSRTFHEDSGPRTFDVSENDNMKGQAFNVTSWTAPAKGTLVRAGGRGNFTYTPDPDWNGVDSFTYTIRSTGGLVSTGSVKLMVTAVNDAPSFVGNPKPVVLDRNAGDHAMPGWGTLVRPGPPAALDEATQGITFSVAIDNPSLFAVPPQVKRTATAADTLAVGPTTGAFAAMTFKLSGILGQSKVCATPVDTGGSGVATDSWGFTSNGTPMGPPQCVRIVVNAPPVAYFQPASRSAAPGSFLTFDPCPAPAPYCTHDPDDQVALWLWEFGDGTTTGETMPGHVYKGTGEYRVRLTVWDQHGQQDSHIESVTIAWPDAAPVEEAANPEPPVANAGGVRTVVEGSTVELVGTAEGATLGTTYRWEQVSGPTVETTGADEATLAFQAPILPTMAPVDLVFSLRASEGTLTGPADYAVVHVVSGNQAPEAVIAPAGPVQPGSAVVLDGAGSKDADGNPLTYRWEQVPVPGEAILQLAATTGETLTFTAPAQPGTVTLRLTVSDGKAQTVDTLALHVASLPEPGGTEAQARPAPVARADGMPGAAGLPWVAALAFGMAVLGTAVAVAIVRRVRK